MQDAIREYLPDDESVVTHCFMHGKRKSNAGETRWKGVDEMLMMKRSWQMQLDPEYDGSLECKSVKSSKVHGIV